MKSVYDLKLHEWGRISDDPDSEESVLKVPGGWIYCISLDHLSGRKARYRYQTVFVPRSEP